MFYSGTLLLRTITILLVLTSLSCSRGERPALERLEIVPFENLSSDSNLKWVGRAAASVLTYTLAPSAELHAQIVESISSTAGTQAARMLEGYFFERNGRLSMVATLEDLRKTKTVASFELGGPAGEGALPLLNQLAKRLSPAARPFGTANEEAFRAYGEALTAGDPQVMVRGLESATKADVRFTAAYLVWARLLTAQGQRDQALKELQAARASNPDAIDSAEIDYFSASIARDVDGRAKALEALTRLTPADPGRFRELAALRFSERRFHEAIQSYEGEAQLAPDDPEVWNQLGYASAFAGDLSGARRALERYGQILGSANSNALDSLGEVSFFLSDFSEAEKYFLQAQEKDPSRRGEELMKAAQARLMAGDPAGADAIFQKYLGLLQASLRKTAVFEQAQWEFLTGRRTAGMARMQQMLPTLEGDQRSLALCQLSIWKLESGSAIEATELAGEAESLARSPRTRNLSAIGRALGAPPGKASGSLIADAYAMLFARRYAEAVALLEAMYREINPTADGHVRTLLAWALVETGRVADARKLVEICPIPLSSGDPVFASLVFPRFLFLKGTVLQNEGKGTEAKRSFELFRKYGG